MEMVQLTQQVLRLQQENVALKKASSADSGHHATNELALAYAKIQILQEENSELSNLRSLHDEYGCPELMQITQREVVHAQLRQRSAEAQSKGFRHLHLANKSMEKQVLTAQKLLSDSTRELRLSEAEVTSLKLSIEVCRQGQMNAEDKVVLLEAELLRCKQREVNSNINLNGMFADVPDTRSVTEYCAAPEQQVTSVDADIQSLQSDSSSSTANQSNITIHIDSSQPKKWNLIKRARAAMAQHTTLNIQGPPELVASLVSGMRTVEIDHKKQTAATEHWKKVANDARVNAVTGPICTVPGHRSMKDELEAKDQQLKMQNQLIATWQKKHAEIKHFMDRAGIEMRAQGVRGVL
jgi:hypothetical protein